MAAKKKKWFPESLVLIFGMIVVAQFLTYVVPAGEFDRVPAPHDESRLMVEAGTYHRVAADEHDYLMPWHLLMAVSRGFAEAQNVIFLIFLVGGVIAGLRDTGRSYAALHSAVQKLGSRPWILIAGSLLIFSLGSWTIGMGEEYVPLIPILVTMCLAMRLDSIVAMGTVWAGYGIGWACAGTNPFGVIIAQNIAGLPPTSGWGFRVVFLVIFLAIGFDHVFRYSRRILKDPESSLVSDVDYSSGFDMPHDVRLTWSRVVVLTAFVGGIVLFVWGAGRYGWYITELNAVFLGVALLAAVVCRIPPNATARSFIRGASEMTAAALLVGFARTIETVLVEGRIIDTIINGIASVLEGAGPGIAAAGMLAVQTVCNFLVPSGSGQAYVTMPIMSPLGTLTGVPQQATVLAYQFGDGFTNMVVPTSALVMGTLALGKIPYGRWVRFVTPLLVKLFGAALVILVVMVYFGEDWGF